MQYCLPNLFRGSFLSLAFFAAVFGILSFFAARTSAAPPKVQLCWQYPASEAAMTAMAVDGDRVLVKLDGGVLKSLRSADGSEEWTAELGGEIISDIVFANGRYYLVTRSIPLNGTGEAVSYLRSLSAETGLPGLAVNVPAADSASLITTASVLIVIGSDGAFSAFDQAGSKIWNFTVSGSVSTVPRSNAETLTIGTTDKAVYRIALATGETIARISGPSIPTSVTFGADGIIYIGDDRGRIYYIDAASGGVKWTFKSGGRIERLSKHRDSLLAVSVDNFIYSIDGNSGRVEWKRRLAGRILGDLAAGSEFIVGITNSSPQVLFMDPRNGNTVETLTLEGEERPVTAALLDPSGTVVLTTTRGVAAYRLGSCQSEKAMS
jgi:outer membrane protein assembly factor BamB